MLKIIPRNIAEETGHRIHGARLQAAAWHIFGHGLNKARFRFPSNGFSFAEFDYDTLVRVAEEKLAEVRQAFEESPLPDEPERDAVNAVLGEIKVGFCA